MVKTSERATIKSWLIYYLHQSQCHKKKGRKSVNNWRLVSERHWSTHLPPEDNLSREVCILPGVCIRYIAKRLPSPGGLKDYHPFLLFHIGSNKTSTRRLWNIKSYFCVFCPLERCWRFRSASSILHIPSWRLEFKKIEQTKWMIFCVASAMIRVLVSVINFWETGYADTGWGAPEPVGHIYSQM